MRSRSSFVRHLPFRRFRAAASPAGSRGRRTTGILGPLAVAVGLAVAGHELPAAPAATAPVPAAATAATFEPVLPERVVRRTLPTTATRSRAGALTQQLTVTKKAAKPVRKKPARATRAARKAPAWVRPAHGSFTSGYGPRWGRMHRGIDIAAPYGTPIYAAAAGVVTFAGAQGGYGRLVTIRHSDGTVTAYGHMSRIYVRSGQRVAAGTRIAAVGSEGRSTGPHLHFEVRRGGAAINPIPFLRARGVFI